MGCDSRVFPKESVLTLGEGDTWGLVSMVLRLPMASRPAFGTLATFGTDFCNVGKPYIKKSQMPPWSVGTKYGSFGKRIFNVEAAQSQSRGRYLFSATYV